MTAPGQRGRGRGTCWTRGMNDQPKMEPAARKRGIAIIVVVVFLFFEAMSHGTQLVYPLPTPWRPLIQMAGFVAGIPLAAAMANRPLQMSGIRKILAVISVPIFCMIIASYYSRRAVEAYAFLNVTPVEKQIPAPIVNMSSGRGADTATVLPDPAAREISVYVTNELWLRLDAYRHPGRDCLILTEQAGRRGIKRLKLPGLFGEEIGTVAFRQCSAA